MLEYNTFPYGITEHARKCIEEQTPFAWVRCGDSEVWVLRSLIDEKYVQVNCPWANQIGYNGCTMPNKQLATRFLGAYQNADVIGIFQDDDTKYVFDTLNLSPEFTNYAFDNLALCSYKPFVQLLKDYPPLIIGQYAEKYRDELEKRLDIKIPGIIVIDNYTQIDYCLDKIEKIQHDWAIISCGVSAKIIAVEAKLKTGKVYLDFGHSLDNALNPVFETCFLTTLD